MKYILVIGDGMADNPVASLANKTPLQAAQIPNMDKLASKGEVGSVINCPSTLPAGSDTGILSIFGCDPLEYYTGRAPLEAAADGIMMPPGDAAYRCNMVCFEDGDMPFEEKRILSHSAGSIEGEQSKALILSLFQDAQFAKAAKKARVHVHPALSFRHIAQQGAADLTDISLAPPHDHLGEKIGPYLPSGSENAKVLKDLMHLAHRVLDAHPINQQRRAQGQMPANGIWFWAEGTAVSLPNFKAQFGKTGAVISAVPLCHGIARLTGLDSVEVAGITGELDTNYEGKVDGAIAALETHDFVAIHVEAPDECTHNGDLKGKIQAIEWLDSRVIAPLVETLNQAGTAYRLLILADHKTLTATRGHDGGAVPYILYDSEKDAGTNLPYCEESGEKGPHHPQGAKSCMQMLFQR